MDSPGPAAETDIEAARQNGWRQGVLAATAIIAQHGFLSNVKESYTGEQVRDLMQMLIGHILDATEVPPPSGETRITDM